MAALLLYSASIGKESLWNVGENIWIIFSIYYNLRFVKSSTLSFRRIFSLECYRFLKKVQSDF